jgi:hypothetical protein
MCEEQRMMPQKGRFKIVDHGNCKNLLTDGPLHRWRCGHRDHVFRAVVDCDKSEVHINSTVPEVEHEQLSVESGLIDWEGQGREATGNFIRVQEYDQRSYGGSRQLEFYSLASFNKAKDQDEYIHGLQKGVRSSRCFCKLVEDGIVDSGFKGNFGSGKENAKTYCVRLRD